MRLWSLAPEMLDGKALVACWRETLLAQKVLLGQTRGYSKHPQLERFRAQQDPVAAIGSYLVGLHAAAGARGYNFDAAKIQVVDITVPQIPVTVGQLELEYRVLCQKVAARDPRWFAEHLQAASENSLLLPQQLRPHTLFYSVPGARESWEKAALSPR